MMPLFGTSGDKHGGESIDAFRRRTKEGMRRTEEARTAARSAMNRLLYELSEMDRRIHGDDHQEVDRHDGQHNDA